MSPSSEIRIGAEDGEIRVRAAVGGRRMTLDLVMQPGEDIVLPRRRVESSLAAGLRQEWLSGANDGSDGTEPIEFGLTCGAGVGSPYLVLTVNTANDTREEVVDIRELVRQWIGAVMADGPTPEVSDG